GGLGFDAEGRRAPRPRWDAPWGASAATTPREPPKSFTDSPDRPQDERFVFGAFRRFHSRSDSVFVARVGPTKPRAISSTRATHWPSARRVKARDLLGRAPGSVSNVSDEFRTPPAPLLGPPDEPPRRRHGPTPSGSMPTSRPPPTGRARC